MSAPGTLGANRNTGDVARTERWVRSFYIQNESWREITVMACIGRYRGESIRFITNF